MQFEFILLDREKKYGALFVWPEIMRFGMVGCHGMMSWSLMVLPFMVGTSRTYDFHMHTQIPCIHISLNHHLQNLSICTYVLLYIYKYTTIIAF